MRHDLVVRQMISVFVGGRSQHAQGIVPGVMSRFLNCRLEIRTQPLHRPSGAAKTRPGQVPARKRGHASGKCVEQPAQVSGLLTRISAKQEPGGDVEGEGPHFREDGDLICLLPPARVALGALKHDVEVTSNRFAVKRGQDQLSVASMFIAIHQKDVMPEEFSVEKKLVATTPFKVIPVG